MKPIISPWIFYLIDKAGTIAEPLIIIGFLSCVATICIYFPAGEGEEWAINVLKKTKIMRILLTIGLIISILLPSKETGYKMLAAYIATPDNIATVGETTEDIIDYIVESVDTLLEKEDE